MKKTLVLLTLALTTLLSRSQSGQGSYLTVHNPQTNSYIWITAYCAPNDNTNGRMFTQWTWGCDTNTWWLGFNQLDVSPTSWTTNVFFWNKNNSYPYPAYFRLSNDWNLYTNWVQHSSILPITPPAPQSGTNQPGNP